MKKPASIGKPYLPTEEAWDAVVTQKLPVELRARAKESILELLRPFLG